VIDAGTGTQPPLPPVVAGLSERRFKLHRGHNPRKRFLA
jgi:hypothetical protein